jgi:hypothetical protein
MQRYLDSGGFTDKNNAYLEIEGANTTVTASAKHAILPMDSEFFKSYIETSPMTYLSQLQSDHANADPVMKPNMFTVSFDGIMKLLPYQGFYPVLRTVQLATMFSQSYGPYIGAGDAKPGGDDENNWPAKPDGLRNQATRTAALMQPWFSPGIMFNTIKSGVAVDWATYKGPVTIDSTTARAAFRGAGFISSSTDADHGGPNFRFPFESLVNPDQYIPLSGANDAGRIPHLAPQWTNYYQTSGPGGAGGVIERPSVIFTFTDVSTNGRKVGLTTPLETPFTGTVDSSTATSTATVIGTSGISTEEEMGQKFYDFVAAKLSASSLNSLYAEQVGAVVTIYANRAPTFPGDGEDAKITNGGGTLLDNVTITGGDGSSADAFTDGQQANLSFFDWSGESKPYYKLAMHNFLAEIPNFFLEDSQYTTFLSQRQSEFIDFKGGNKYYMDIALRKNKDMVMYEGPAAFQFPGSTLNSTGSSRGMHYGPNAMWTTSSFGVAASTLDETAATATITFAGSIAYDQTITIVSTDDTSRTYTAKAANDYANNQFDADGGFDDKAEALKGAIEHSSGHSSKITVSRGGTGNAVLTLTQATAGTDGNNTITENLGNTTVAGFTGGIDDGGEAQEYKRNLADPATAPWTPPYFYGTSIARVEFDPLTVNTSLGTSVASFTLDEIFEGSSIEYINLCERHPEFGQYGTTREEATNEGDVSSDSDHEDGLGTGFSERTPASGSFMHLSSSMNLLGKSSPPIFKLAPNQITGQNSINAVEPGSDPVWVISPKFECPIMNFSGNAGPAKGTANADLTEQQKGCFEGMGMWKGSGSIPQGADGIWMELRESFPTETLRPTSTKKSLIDAVGFKTERKRIGRISQNKTISEAIVAIPYTDTPSGPKLFDINTTAYNTILANITNGEPDVHSGQGGLPPLMTVHKTSIGEMIGKMKKYVIPPFLDFSHPDNYKPEDPSGSKIKPFVMYIMEFEHTLDREDLQKIWQNVMPKIAQTAKKAKRTISHQVGVPWEFFPDGLPENKFKFKIFKVKRRAKNNYYDSLPKFDTDKIQVPKFAQGVGTGQQLPYSYNWPYDFFSLIELAQMETSVTFEPAGFATYPPNSGFEYNLFLKNYYKDFQTNSTSEKGDET